MHVEHDSESRLAAGAHPVGLWLSPLKPLGMPSHFGRLVARSGCPGPAFSCLGPAFSCLGPALCRLGPLVGGPSPAVAGWPATAASLAAVCRHSAVGAARPLPPPPPRLVECTEAPVQRSQEARYRPGGQSEPEGRHCGPAAGGRPIPLAELADNCCKDSRGTTGLPQSANHCVSVNNFNLAKHRVSSTARP